MGYRRHVQHTAHSSYSCLTPWTWEFIHTQYRYTSCQGRLNVICWIKVRIHSRICGSKRGWWIYLMLERFWNYKKQLSLLINMACLGTDVTIVVHEFISRFYPGRQKNHSIKYNIPYIITTTQWIPCQTLNLPTECKPYIALTGELLCAYFHDDVMKWKYLPRYWPFVRGNSPVTGEFPS